MEIKFRPLNQQDKEAFLTPFWCKLPRDKQLFFNFCINLYMNDTKGSAHFFGGELLRQGQCDLFLLIQYQ